MNETRVDITPDPRISNLRPAWLADNQAWRDQLQAMDRDDAAWVEHHWDMADGAKPALDVSWLQMETIGDNWRPVAAIVVPVVAFCILLGWLLSWLAMR